MNENEIQELECPEHGPYKAQCINIFGRSFYAMCPECERIEAAQEEERRLKYEQQKKEQCLIERGIEPEFFEASFENYKAENKSEEEALTVMRSLANGNIRKVLLLGSNGVGKTHLAAALVRAENGIIITMFKLSAEIRNGYANNQSEIEVLDNLLTYPVIVIDELGRTKGSDAERNWLSYLVDKAHVRGIKLVIISNRLPADYLPEGRKGEAFEYFVDNDVISRLREKSRVVVINGRDRRTH